LAELASIGLVALPHRGVGIGRVAETEEMTDLVREDGPKIEAHRIDGDVCREGVPRVDVDVRVVDVARPRVEGDGRHGERAFPVGVGPLVVVKDDHVGVAVEAVVLLPDASDDAEWVGEVNRGSAAAGASDLLPRGERLVGDARRRFEVDLARSLVLHRK